MRERDSRLRRGRWGEQGRRRSIEMRNARRLLSPPDANYSTPNMELFTNRRVGSSASGEAPKRKPIPDPPAGREWGGPRAKEAVVKIQAVARGRQVRMGVQGLGMRRSGLSRTSGRVQGVGGRGQG